MLSVEVRGGVAVEGRWYEARLVFGYCGQCDELRSLSVRKLSGHAKNECCIAYGMVHSPVKIEHVDDVIVALDTQRRRSCLSLSDR